VCLYLNSICQATVSLKVVSRKRRRKCTLKIYDYFAKKYYLRLTIKGDGKVKSGGRYHQVLATVLKLEILCNRNIYTSIYLISAKGTIKVDS
jgi:hypothetical protein